MIRKSIKTLLATFTLLCGGFFCYAQAETKPITILETVHNHQFNPHLTDYAADVQILTGLYEGLFTYNPLTLEPQYAIAIDFSISRDKKRWTITLNPNARFSDGSAITANSVRDSWIALLQEKNAPYASLLDVIEGAQDFRKGKGSAEDLGIYVLEDYKLMIHLTKPAGYLPKILCHPAFSIVSKNPEVYSGPYCLGELSPWDAKGGQKIVLRKNENYWDKDRVFTNEIIFIQSDDSDNNSYLYNTGDVDWVSSNVDTKKLIQKDRLLFNAEYATCYLFFKNSSASSREPSPWDHLEFRQALFEAMPWNQVRSLYFVPATTFVYPLSGYPQVQGYDFTDDIQAQKLMSQARQKYGIPLEEKIPLVMEISTNSFTMEQLYAMKLAFDKLNIDFQVKTLSPASYLDNVKSSEADIFIYTWIGDFADPMAFLELFRSQSSLNVTGFNNATFDELLDKAASTTGTESYEFYAQAETLLLDECEVLPIHHPVVYNVIDTEEIGGWALNAFDIHPLKYLYRKEKITQPGNNVI